MDRKAMDTLIALADYVLKYHEREAEAAGDNDDLAFFRHLRTGSPYPPKQGQANEVD